MVGYDREDLVCGPHALDGPDAAGMARPRPATMDAGDAERPGPVPPFEKEYFRKDGSRVPVLVGVGELRRETRPRSSPSCSI